MSTRAVTIAALVLVACVAVLVAQDSATDTEGEVISIQGEIINILVRSGPAPGVGDTVSVMNRPDENGNATSVGEWRVTEVRGSDVKAVLVQRYGGEPSQGMLAFFTSSRGEDYREGPDVEVPGSASSGVPGKVIEVRGEEVTVSLDRDAVPAVGDRVELSFTVGDDTISLGRWRVTKVRGDGRVDAEPEDVQGEPTPNMDAVVWVTGRRVDVPTSTYAEDATGKKSAHDLFVEGRSLVDEDPARAVSLIVEAAERGDAEAQNYYGMLLGTGRAGVAKDNAQAVIWYRRAAAGGDSWAQANLCNRHINGDGVEKDYQEALRFCRLAEAQNNPSALNDLGWIHQNGFGVEKNIDVAVPYYRRSAELGYSNGQNNLGYMYEQGWGVNRDYQQALRWYRKAAAQGHAWAEWNLGRVYQEGLGVPPDQAAAIEHYRRAARAGHTASQERLQQLGQSW